VIGGKGLVNMPPGASSRKKRRRLAPWEKYELFVSVLTGQATQREAATMWGVDRSTVISVCRVAKQGALDALAAAVPGRRGGRGVAAAQAEIERLRATVGRTGGGGASA
jgi:hypothetical protein